MVEGKGGIGGEGFTAGHAGLRSQGSLEMRSGPTCAFVAGPSPIESGW